MPYQQDDFIAERRNLRTIDNSVSIWLIVLVVFLMPGNLLAWSHDSCPIIETLTLNTTTRWELPERPRGASELIQCYELTVPSAGVLFLDISALGSRIIEPQLAVSGGHQVVRETPRGAILTTKASGSVLITVRIEPERGSFHRSELLPAYKLRNAFISEDGLPTEEIIFNEDLPDTCIEQASGMAPQLFTQSSTVALTEVDEDDCDVMTLTSEVPGVVFIESPETPLQAALFSSVSCAGTSLMAEGVLGGGNGPVVAPLHSGEIRMTLDPVAGAVGEPRPIISFFAPCDLGETDDHGDTPLCATPWIAGEVAGGTLENFVGDDEDFFTFVLEGQQAVRLEMFGGEGVEIALYDEELLELALGPVGEALRWTRILPKGRYYLGVQPGQGFKVEAEYAMHLEFLD